MSLPPTDNRILAIRSAPSPPFPAPILLPKCRVVDFMRFMGLRTGLRSRRLLFTRAARFAGAFHPAVTARAFYWHLFLEYLAEIIDTSSDFLGVYRL